MIEPELVLPEGPEDVESGGEEDVEEVAEDDAGLEELLNGSTSLN